MTENWWDDLLTEASLRKKAEAIRLYGRAMRVCKKLKACYNKALLCKIVDDLMQADAMGYTMAGYRLGCMCEARNPDRALSYYDSVKQPIRKLAKAGDAEAELCLAEMYYHGRGVAENRTKAEEWLCKAVEHGNPEAKKVWTDWCRQKQDERHFHFWECLAEVSKGV